MWIGTLALELHLPPCRSRKEKRSLVRSMVERVRTRFNAACSEVGHLEDLRLTQIGVAVVTNQRSHAEQSLDRIEAAMLSRQPEVEVVTREHSIYSL